MIRLWRFALVLCLALPLPFAAPESVRAQDDAALSASARALFEDGVQLADQGQWKDAADRFRRALALRDSAVIRFNLASALSELGQVVEASELFRALLRAPNLDASVQAQAEQRLAQASQRIAKLTVEVPSAVQGARVELDGKLLAPALVGAPTMVDPGAHTARLVRGDAELDAQQVEVGPGESRSLSLQPRAPTPEQTANSAVDQAKPTPVVLADSAAGREDTDPNKRKKRLWWGLGAGAVAVVAGAVITGVLLAHGSKDPKPYSGDFEPGSVSVKVNP